MCRYPILGGFLASRPEGALTVAQRDGSAPQLEVAVTGYQPRPRRQGLDGFAAGLLYTALAGAAAPRREPPLPRPHRLEVSMKDRGVRRVGRDRISAPAAARRRRTRSSRSRAGAHEDGGDVRWLVADATDEASLGVLEGMDVAVYLAHTRSALRAFAESTGLQPRTSPAPQAEPGSGRSSFSAVSATTVQTCRRTCAAGTRRPRALASGSVPGDDAARRDGGGRRERSLRDDPRARRPAAGDGLPTVGRGTDAADRASRRRAATWPRVCGHEAAYGRAFDVGGPERDDLPRR